MPRFLPLVFLCCLALAGYATDFYVSPGGSDANPGSNAKPFRTLEAARDAIRKLKKHGPVTVWLDGGVYERSEPFLLGAKDMGTKEAPIVYRAKEGKTVRLVGGKTLPPEAFKPVTDEAVLQRLPAGARTQVRQADLKALGITDYGALHPTGFMATVQDAPMELVYNDACMTPARWPNEGYAQYGKVTPPATFAYTGDAPARWTHLDQAWVYSCWFYDWADVTIPITAVDTVAKTITLANPPRNYGMADHRPYYVFNLLEELDSPGEYYIDRAAGILYFWPPSPLAQGRAVVTLLRDPLVAMEDTAFITVRGLTLEAARGLGVYLKGGSDNLVAGCTLRNLGTAAIMIGVGEQRWDIGNLPGIRYEHTAWNRDGGTHNGVQSCDIYNTGAYGIILGGGDRKTLTPCNNFVVNCDIHHTNRWYKQNFPPIEVPGGVGFRIANNHIHDAPHSAIMYWGNETLIELNEIDRCVTDSTDAGAIYTGRDPSAMGNTIRYNYLHHIGGLAGGYGTEGVFIDDGSSRQQVTGNLFYKVGSTGALHIHGGQANVFDNNMLIDTNWGRFTAWNQQRWSAWLQEPLLQTRLKSAVDVTKPPYADKYPELATIFETPYSLTSNLITRSFIANANDPVFVDDPNMIFRVKDWTEVAKRVPGFASIPLEKIGLYADEYRKTVPGK